MTAPAALVWSGSTLETFRDCEEKYRFRYEEHLIPKKILGREVKRSFGTAFHAAVETYHKSDGDIDQAELAFIKVAREADLPLTIDETDEPRTVERGLALFHAYLDRWKNEPFRLLRDKDGKPYVEIRFSLHLFDYKGIPVLYAGIIDKIVEAGARIYVPDLKTTRRGLSQFQNSMRPNHKLTGYYVGAKSILGDKVFAIGHDAVFISKRKPNPKKGGWMAHGVDIEKDFMRTYTTRSQTDVDIWLRATIRTILDIIKRREEEEGPWDQNAPLACWRYGRCDYLDACLHNRDPIVMDSFYEKSEWHTIAEARADAEEEPSDEDGSGSA